MGCKWALTTGHVSQYEKDNNTWFIEDFTENEKMKESSWKEK